MKQLLILSGKGGTGKTTIASAFIKLSGAKVFADCDVDAPNLHLIKRNFEREENFDYFGMDKAFIHSEKCIQCGICQQECRFDAIQSFDKESKNGYLIDTFACEGCGVCERICPVGAIEMKPEKAGELKLFSGNATFSTAKLKMGSGTSGLLVSEVKKKLKANTSDVPLAIIDGSPGIGCPVISSISGVDMVLIVTEPSVSGINDMKRIVETAKIFQPKVAICINKYDTNVELSEKIEQYCLNETLKFVGKVPFDIGAVKAVNLGLTIVETDTKAARAVQDVFTKTMAFLENDLEDDFFKINRG